MPTRKQKAPAPKPAAERRMPAQERSLQRVAAVLSAAREALVELGYGRMTMLDIAARAGVTHSSIYHYFKSVEEILAALMQSRLNEANTQGIALMEDARTAGELIDACIGFWRTSFQMYRELPEVLPLYVAARIVPALTEIEQRDYRQLIRLISAQFRRILPKLDAGVLSADITALVCLTVPMYDLVLQQPKTQQAHMQAQLEEMMRLRMDKTLTRYLSESELQAQGLR